MSLRDRILATLAYYDVLDFPLKTGEVLRYLFSDRRFGGIATKNTKTDINDISRELNSLAGEKILCKREKYYFLSDREYIVPLRQKNQKLAEEKLRKTRKAIRWLAFVPFIKAIFASGSLSLGNTNELSDLDILVVAKSGRIWTARAFTLFVLSVLGVRRKPTHIVAPDKVCPNHFITDSSLAIPFHSIYTAQLYANLMPLFASDDLVIDKFRDHNKWMFDFLQSWEIGDITVRRGGVSGVFARTLEAILSGSAGKFVERVLKRYQVKRIKKTRESSSKTNNQKKGRITYTDEQLEFHPTSPESRIIPAYNGKMISLGLSEFANEKDSGLS